MKSSVLALLAISFLSTNIAIAQPRQDPLTREGVMQGFDRNSPAVGDSLPDLQAYNPAGETIRLGELKGQYTVLVFGCLT